MFTVTIAPGFAAIRYRRGRFVGVLPSGRHRTGPRVRHVLVDLRERLLTLSPQEIPTADGVAVKVTATLRMAVTEPRAFVERAQDPLAVVYLAAQLALREELAALTAAELAARGNRLPLAELTARIGRAAADVGVEVTELAVKDVVLPVELRQAAMELVTVRQRAAVQLEQARAETAALRSMANAAKLLDDHPALARMRLVQAAGYGTKVVLRLGDPAESAAE